MDGGNRCQEIDLEDLSGGVAAFGDLLGMTAAADHTKLQFEVDGAHIVLVDDVLNTGRTIRAVVNELFDFGRPASVRLAVLVDRGGRELPIQPDYVGVRLAVARDLSIELSRGPGGLLSIAVESRSGN